MGFPATFWDDPPIPRWETKRGRAFEAEITCPILMADKANAIVIASPSGDWYFHTCRIGMEIKGLVASRMLDPWLDSPKIRSGVLFKEIQLLVGGMWCRSTLHIREVTNYENFLRTVQEGRPHEVIRTAWAFLGPKFEVEVLIQGSTPAPLP